MSRKDRPIYTDGNGTRRFRGNEIVRYLLDEATAGRKCDMTDLAVQVKFKKLFSAADWQEFYQLIGYSLCGYAEVFPHSKERK